ncbi:MAG: hypothetical protein PHH28_04120 [Desulfuromonadaceae bacterium]|nr:hypothetical protein [Desulfuromonadaceae bacterium]
MRFVTSIKIFLCLNLMFIFPISAHAIPTITCHCFTDRSYDPAQPSMADPYFLASAQNSFFAIVFNTDKRTIVLKKQQGISPDDLWVAYWIASKKSGTTPDSLLQAKRESKTWKHVIVPLGLSPKTLGTRFLNALNANELDIRLSDAVVDDLFLKARLLGEGDLAALRKEGATNQELILATTIATKTRQAVKQVYLEVKSGAKTWGSLLTEAKIDTKNMQQEIASILKLRPQ